MQKQGSSGVKRRRSAPPEVVVHVPVAGTRSICLSEALPVFLNRLPGAADGLAMFSLQGPLDDSAVAAALAEHLAPGHSLRQASLAFDGLSLPGLVVAAGSAPAAAAIYSMTSKAPAVVDGALIGLRAWLSSIESAKVDPRELQASVDAFMTELDTREERDGAAVGALTKRMDADGFTLVTRKKGGAAAASAALPGLAPPDESDNAKSKRKRGSLQKTDFYAWQGRDAKLDRLAELRRRFEEDKERIRRMQQARRGAEFA